MTPNGDVLPLLLKMQDDVSATRRDVAHIKERMDVTEPVLWRLESERTKDIGWREGVTRYVNTGHALWAAGLGGLFLWAWQHIGPLLPRV